MKTQSSVLRPHDFLFLLLLATYIVAGMALVPFHGDEATQIYMSRDYAYQLLQRDLSLVTYRDPPVSAQEQDLRLLNGTINKYLIGLSWHLVGFSVDDLNEQWDWGGDWNYNQQNNHAPSEALLLVSRIPSTLLLAAGAVAMFGLGWQLGGRPAAYLAALFYALNPVLLLNGRRAMMEGSFIAFSLLTVLAALWWLKLPSPPTPLPQGEGRRGGQLRQWVATISLGVAAGLALASKHTALFTVTAVFGACLIWIVYEWVRHHLTPSPAPFPEFREGENMPALGKSPSLNSGRDLGWGRLAQLSVASLLAFAVFYMLNPAWWGDPLARAGQVLERRQELLSEQTAVFGGYDGFGEMLAGFGRQVLIAQPQYSEAPGWGSYIGDQIARYEASPWRGLTMGGAVVGAFALGALVIVGVWTLLWAKDIPTSTRWLIGVWALTMIVTTALLTPIEWQRYYLPVYPVMGLLAAAGGWSIIRVIQRVRLTRV
jgi:hypothetical protein